MEALLTILFLSIGESWINYYDTAPGSTFTRDLTVYMEKYSASSGKFVFSKDVTASAVYTITKASLELASGTDASGKIHASMSGNRMTCVIDKDIQESGQLNVTVHIEADGAVTDVVLGKNILAATHHLIPNEDFLYPISGQTSKLDLTMKKYTADGETVVPIGKLRVNYTETDYSNDGKAMEIFDSSGNPVSSEDYVTEAQLPLTIKAYTENTSLYMQAYDTEGNYLSYLDLNGYDYFYRVKCSLSSTSLVYTGKNLTPKVTVKYGSKTIPASEYTVTYANNKSVGTASVKIEHNNITKLLSFKIVPKAPVLSKVAPQSSGKGLTVTWGKVTGASGYYVYQRIGSGSYKRAKTITSGSTVSWNDTAAKTNGTKYSYYVIAYRTVSGVKYNSAKSAAKTYYFVTRPAISSAANTASKKMTVKWGKNTKATGYQVKYVTGSTSKTVTISSYKTVSRVISSLVKGKTYKVYVRSIKKVGSVKYYSAWSAAKSVKITK